jgi:Glycosyltransferase family 87
LSILARAIRTWESKPTPVALPAIGWARLSVLAIAAVLAVLFVSAAVVLWTDVLKTYEQRSSFEPREGRGDFIAFYVVGEFVLEGNGDEIYDLESLSRRENELMPPTDAESRELPFYNPPFAAGIFALISLLAYDRALWLWLVVNVTALAACVALLDRLLVRESPLLRLLFALAAISSVPVYRALGLGQASLLVLLLTTLAFTWLAEGRQRVGVMVGLLLIKPQYALLPALHLLLTRRREALVGLALVAAAALIASIGIAGPQVVVEYPRLLLDSSSWSEEKGIYPANWFSWTGFLHGLSVSSPASTMLGLTVGMLGAGAALFISARNAHQPSSVLAGGAALTVAILLLSPHVYRQDLVLLLLPAAVLLSLTNGVTRALAVAFLLLLWLVAWTPVTVPAVPEPPWSELSVEELGFNLFVPLMAVLLVSLLWLANRHRTTVTAER